MMFSVKICGLTQALHARAAIEAGASHLGFVFFPPSPRHVTLESVSKILAALGAGADKVQKVALVVDPEPELLRALLESGLFDAVQFHGREEPDDLKAFKAEAAKQGRAIALWKALGVSAREDLKAADKFLELADLLLFDARPPKDANRPGGHGETFDWSLLKAYDGASPWILAGGLSPENVADAIRAVKDFKGFTGVDVSSGVEAAPGSKDPDMIRRFVTAAQDAIN